ncbi:glycosyltransferase family 4 protein [Vibrio sp. dsl-7]|uniref:Glycosyltransferase family 4 protein n=1 Tax=Vibrio chanodichtyis TaxID=3027932 RepID=A0ABT5V1K8_9VIBR|nr:glycosyltransferase family 4 protein [Vibrio chanodichtyis]MDE1515546.1 glycosyltransferase family 4 protein [Vibrio chanodichtyis]
MELSVLGGNDSKIIVFIVNVGWYFNLHWLERAEYFKSCGYCIHIIGNFNDVEVKDELTAKGYVCYHLAIKRKSINPFKEITNLIQLKNLLSTIKPDLIHSITIKPNIYSGILNRIIFNKPIIYSVTGLGAVFSSSKLKFFVLRFIVVKLYKLVSAESAHFIFENSEDYDFFKKIDILKYRNGSVIKGAGIDLIKFKPSIPPMNKTILFAARLLEDKGLRCLIEARRQLEEKGFQLSLNVAGIIDSDVSSAIPIKQIERWSQSGDINWLGNVKDMPNLISMNDVVCLPTTYGEGVPRILIEAASCQRAIVATDVAGCREIVSHGVNGYLVTPNDDMLLACFLQNLLEDTNKLLEFGINGRKKVEEEFSQEVVFEKTLHIYQKLLGE